MSNFRNLLLGAVCLALIPVLLIDIPKHYLDWKDEVRSQIIIITQNFEFHFNQQQKAKILDHIFDRNASLVTAIAWKSLVCLLCLGLGIYFLRKNNQTAFGRVSGWKTSLSVLGICVTFAVFKFIYRTSFQNNQGSEFITIPKTEYSLEPLCNRMFKGKLVYIDFWGTTCPACLDEFTYFTSPLREKYKNNPDVVFLYVCQGYKYIWRQQIQQYDLKGYHLFVNLDQYEKLYRNAARDRKAMILMPRYVLIDKAGKFVTGSIKEPSSTDTLYHQIDTYLQAGKQANTTFISNSKSQL